MAVSDRNGSGRVIYRLINGAHSSESGAGLRGGYREPSRLERIRRHLQPSPLTGSRVVNDAAETNIAQLVLNGTRLTNGASHHAQLRLIL